MLLITQIIILSASLLLMACVSTPRQVAATTVQKVPLMPAQYSQSERYALNLKTDSKITTQLRALTFKDRLKLSDVNPALLTHGHYYCEMPVDFNSSSKFREEDQYFSKLLKIKNPFAYLEDQYSSQVQQIVERENQIAYKALACHQESQKILQGLLDKAGEKIKTYDSANRLISVTTYQGLAYKNMTTVQVDTSGNFRFDPGEKQEASVLNVIAADDRDKNSLAYMPLRGSNMVGFLNSINYFRYGKTLMEFYVVKFDEDFAKIGQENRAVRINQKLSDGSYEDVYDAMVPVGMLQNYNDEVIALNYVEDEQIFIGKLFYDQIKKKLMITQLLSADRNHQVKKMIFDSKGLLGVLVRNQDESTVYFWDLKNELILSKNFSSTDTQLNLVNDRFLIQDMDLYKDSVEYIFNVGAKNLEPTKSVRGDDRNYKIDKLFYKAAHGEEYPLLLAQPVQGEPEFILLKAYGGFFLEAFDPIGFEMRYLVSKKALIAQAFVRGDSDLGYDEWFKGLKAGKRDAIQDVIAATEKLKKLYPRLKDKIFFEGWSNGGMLALNTVIEKPELFAGVIAGSPNTDLLQHERLNAQRWSYEYGEMSELNILLEVSPYYMAMKSSGQLPPILLRAAYDDLNVSPVNSFKMLAALRNYHTGGPFYLITRPFGEGHNLSNSTRAKVEEYSYIYSFIDQILDSKKESNIKEK